MKNKSANISDDLSQKRPKKQMMVFSLAVILLICFPVAVFASYIYNVVLNNYAATADEEFYFTSDLLGADLSAIPTYYLGTDWQSAATITFKLRNFDSTLNISASDIAYSVTATASGSSAEGTLAAGGSPGNEATIELSIPVPADPNSPLTVTVTAVSTSPYTKTLQGIFIINSALSYTIADNAGSPIAWLKVTLEKDSTAALTRAVTINWPVGASPDMTNPIVINATSLDLTARTMTTVLNKAAVYELIFFKDSPAANYSGVTVS
ncbi:hypothetical protein JT05_01590 [Desulfosporosinus sp. Tol-M]|jgi:hypothetical protein|nr:hypothetical protein JT05_01590 [Desulfosporosinus sp. Tol-M]